MRIWLSTLVVAFIITHFPAALLAEEPATATGNVVDAAGNPVPHATVMVYSAGVARRRATAFSVRPVTGIAANDRKPASMGILRSVSSTPIFGLRSW
jgi:hypothetical protein